MITVVADDHGDVVLSILGASVLEFPVLAIPGPPVARVAGCWLIKNKKNQYLFYQLY